MGEAVYAHKTITFDSPKCGNIMFPGADYNGELVIKPIGIPREIHEKMNLKLSFNRFGIGIRWYPKKST